MELDGEYRSLGASIGSDEVGLRIDSLLTEKFRFFSRSAWQKRLRTGWVRVNEATVSSSYRLKLGDQISMFYPETIEPFVDKGIYPIWKKGAVMAVYKPGNLPMHENGPYRKNTFAYLLREQMGEEWAAVHRLDKETSGIVLCGGSYEVRKELAGSLAKRVLSKEYRAIARGSCQQVRWVAKEPIGDLEESEIRIKKWVSPTGQQAHTDFELIETKGDFVYLKAFPKTGRTNQIRIHAAYHGLPLIGDRLYHPDEKVFLNWFESGISDAIVEQTGFHRCLLHAYGLKFVHPETQTLEEIVCPLPEDMQAYWQDPQNSRWLKLPEEYKINSSPKQWLDTIRAEQDLLDF